MKKLITFLEKYGTLILILMVLILWFKSCGLSSDITDTKKAIVKHEAMTDSTINILSNKILTDKDIKLLNNDLLRDYSNLISDMIKGKLTNDELIDRLSKIEKDIKEKKVSNK
jgi:hypothetical protein